MVSYSDINDPAWESTGARSGFDALLRKAWRTRAYGDFWSYMLLADGAVDIATEPALALHDMAAPAVIVEEAGGRFSDLQRRHDIYGGGPVVFSNGAVHDAVLTSLAG